VHTALTRICGEDCKIHKLDVYGSVCHNTNLVEVTNKMQLCRTIIISSDIISHDER